MRILANTTTLPLFAPLGAVILAWTALTWFEPIPSSAVEILAVAPFLLFGAGAALATYFRLSNATFQFVLLIAAHFMLTYAGTQPAAAAARIAGLTALLVPINIALFGVIEDRGLLTYDGIVRWLALGLQAGLAALAILLVPRVVSDVLAAHLLPWRLPLPDIAQLAAAPALAISALNFARRRTPLEAATLAGLIVLLVGLAWPAGSTDAALLLSATGLILAVAVLQNGYRLAFLDELTRLPGRRALELELKRLSGPYTVAMVDVDHFKKFNDTYGHDVGDQALRLIARCLRQVGGGGRAYRYGGEEFTVLFPGQSAGQAASALEELRSLVATTPFRLRRPDRPKSKRARARRGTGAGARILNLTVSIGMAERTEAVRQPDAVLKAADRALYRAKSRGRNQVAR